MTKRQKKARALRVLRQMTDREKKRLINKIINRFLKTGKV
jgi:hypothetical protein